MAATPPSRYRLDDLLSPRAKESLRHLELYARRKVQGLLHGIHRSKRVGVSTDFDHHKNYQPGDPLKHVDWKVSARHDRFYVKRYTEDTALSVRLIVDRSASMLQATGDQPSKFLTASRLAACLGYLILHQKDAAGLVLSASDETFWLPVRAADSHLVAMLQALASRGPAAADALPGCLKALLDRAERRGLVVLVTDGMFEPEPVRRGLARLQAQGHEVLMLLVQDPTEEEFPFNRWVEFRSLEDAAVRHRLDAVLLKRLYREEYQAWLGEWRQWARKYDIHLVPCRTDAPVETVLSSYLACRAK